MTLGIERERAPRFPLHVPVRYGRFRKGPDADAVTVNVSRTGILFTTCGEAPATGECLECILHLPFGASVRSIGHVARTAPAPDGTQVAVQIERYWIRPRKRTCPPAETGADRSSGKPAGIAAGTAAPAPEDRSATTVTRAARKPSPRGEHE
jgi:hypothetical protein